MKVKVLVVAFATLVMTLFVASAGVLSSSVIAQQSQNAHFIANLSGKSAPSHLNLSAEGTGKATFTVTEGGKRMLYSVNATKISHVDNVVLVSTASTQRASNVVLLRTGSQQGATGPINGLLVHGNITSSSLVGPLKGKQISNLVKDMLDGHIDLWVTTTKGLMIAGKVTPAA